MPPTDDAPTADRRHSSPGPRGTVGDAPPARLPGIHFAAALVFLALGALGLAWSGPAIAAGSFSSPRVIGSFHLLTLGWIGTSIMGASTQLLPVALGARLRWPGLGFASFAAWAAGTAAFAGGMLADVRAAYLFGAGALGAGAVLFAANLWATLPRAPDRDLTWWCLGASGLFLLAGWVLGMLLAVNLRAGILGATRYSVLSVHVHLMAGGWVLLTMIGVGHRLLPRFLGSRSVSPWPMRLAAGLTALGSLLLVASEHILPVGVIRVALWTLAAGAAAFVLAALVHFRERSRSPGAEMGLAGGGLALLFLAVGAGMALLALGPRPGAVMAYGLLLVPGGFALFVAGMASRIVPFLAKIHGGPREGPALGAAAVLLTVGAAGLGAGPLLGSAALTTGVALVYAAGAVLLTTRLLPLAWRLVTRTVE